jgi:hypothetical protein
MKPIKLKRATTMRLCEAYNVAVGAKLVADQAIAAANASTQTWQRELASVLASFDLPADANVEVDFAQETLTVTEAKQEHAVSA